MRSIKPVLMLAVAVAGLASATSASAQFRRPEDAVRYRQAAFSLMSAHFNRIAAMTSGRVPFDAKAVVSNAEIATFISQLPYAAFIDGSDKGNSRALPKVWTEPEKFLAAAKKMQDEMLKLNAVAKTGHVESIKVQVGETDKACKSCHDEYRKE